jgi:hypothetical protein
MDTNDDFRKNIDDIKSDISMIKTSIDTLSLEFNTHIQNHSVTSNNPANTAVLVHDIKTDISIENNVDINDTDNLENSIDSESDKFNLIYYSFIENNDNNKSLLKVLSVSNGNMNPLYKKDFLQFCSCTVGLVESVMKIFLKNKFFEENNDRLLKACDLVEQKYPDTKPKTWKFPDIYLSKDKYNDQNVNDYYYQPKRDEYLSLDKLKGQDIYFKLELCFVILYGDNFYKKPYSETPTINSNRQTSNQALRRPSPKITSSIEPYNKKFYDRINNAREFRHIFTHDPYNPKGQQEELEKKLSKYNKLKNDLDNYDGILEAVNWFIRQMYIDMTKN